ncbi:MAG: sulfotransferase [Alphaproteobacteria bacterium]|nr:sulfotransferase [Alphaproteobacteria bacterium]
MAVAPFFIVGCGRSGTTLLKSIVSAHPALFVMPETFFFRSISPNIPRCGLEPWRAASGWWLADMGITPDGLEPAVKARMASGASRECSVLGAIFDFHAAANPGVAIGEKTPDHVNHIARIRQCFPNAKIIQIIRDPRAVVASFRKVKVGSNAIADITAEWARTEEILELNTDSNQFLALRYEDLVSNPEAQIREVCAFLGVEWTTKVLNFHSRKDANYAPEQAHHENTRKPLFSDSVNSWRDVLSPNEVGLIESALSAGMQRQGYSLEGGKVALPSLQMGLSRLGGLAHRFLVRIPRQRIKAVKARRRLARESSRG